MMSKLPYLGLDVEDEPVGIRLPVEHAHRRQRPGGAVHAEQIRAAVGGTVPRVFKVDGEDDLKAGKMAGKWPGKRQISTISAHFKRKQDKAAPHGCVCPRNCHADPAQTGQNGGNRAGKCRTSPLLPSS